MTRKSERLYNTSLLREIIGDEDEIKNMLQIFLDSMPEILEDLNQAYEQGNIEQTAKTAHKMKSSLDTLKVQSLYDTVRKIDKTEKAEKLKDELPRIIGEINTMVELVLEQIREDHNL